MKHWLTAGNILEGLGILALLIPVLPPLLKYYALPGTIPRHSTGFSDIQIKTVQVAHGHTQGLGVWFTPAFILFFLFVPVIYSIFFDAQKIRKI